MKYVVIKAHRSGYPRPIRVAKGDLLEIGQRYEGSESGLDWYLCTCAGQEPGWIPAQLIERVGVAQGRALAHYCAHELDVDPGQQVIALQPMNGWIWCRRVGNGELGWLPHEKVQLLA